MEKAKKPLEGPKEPAIADPKSQSLPPPKSHGHARAPPVPAKKPQVVVAKHAQRPAPPAHRQLQRAPQYPQPAGPAQPSGPEGTMPWQQPVGTPTQTLYPKPAKVDRLGAPEMGTPGKTPARGARHPRVTGRHRQGMGHHEARPCPEPVPPVNGGGDVAQKAAAN